ncbi:MAG: HD domain-containing protein [bacterium]|nr:HD domain-containing protein [bacterium]
MKEIILAAEKFCNENIPSNRIKSHYLKHISLVRHYGQTLAREYNANQEIVDLAAILHDMGAEQGEVHAQASADIAKNFFKKFKIKKDDLDNIIIVIANHSSKKPGKPYKEDVTLETKIMRDADALSFFDDTYIGYYQKKIETMASDSAKKVTLEKMIQMKQKITTPLGLQLANDKYQAAVKYFDSI